MVSYNKNTPERFKEAIETYQKKTPVRNEALAFRVVLRACIDVSGSMEGNKLMAVKLGLCAIAAHLQLSDFISVSIFDNRIRDLTPGYVSVEMIRKVRSKFFVRCP